MTGDRNTEYIKNMTRPTCVSYANSTGVENTTGNIGDVIQRTHIVIFPSLSLAMMSIAWASTLPSDEGAADILPSVDAVCLL